MTITPTQRDKVLMTIIPAAAICLAWFAWLRPEAQQWSKVEAARAAAPSPSALGKQKVAVEQLKKEERESLAVQKDWIGRWNQLRREHQEIRSRAETTERMAELFRRHNLTLIKEDSPDNAKTGQASGLLAQVFERLHHTAAELVPELNPAHRANHTPAAASHLSATAPQPNVTPPAATPAVAVTPTPVAEVETTVQGGPKHTLWKIEFAGRYSDVQASLAELAASGSRAIPVQLVMAKAKPELTLRRWTLYIWI